MPPCSWRHAPPSHTSVVAGVVVVGVGMFITWLHRSVPPPPPKICGSPDGPPVTALRVKLKDGRHVAYKEFGVPRDIAQYKVIFVHGFNGSRHLAPDFSKAFLEKHSIYVVSFDRAGYGQSDPNPSRNIKSEAQDIEQLADLLELGSTFYLLPESIGGYSGWSCLKYIPHRLAGVGMIVPVTNFWWKCFSKEEFKQAFGTQVLMDRLFLRVVRHLPWLTYFWMTQPWIPTPNPVNPSVNVMNATDREVLLGFAKNMSQESLAEFAEGTQQGIAESLCRDVRIMFGDWEFDPCDLEDPFSNRPGAVDLWQGEEDYLVPKELQRIIHRRLPWVHYYELKGEGHLLKYREGFPECALKTLLFNDKFQFQGSH